MKPLKMPPNSPKSPSTSISQLVTQPNYSENSFSKTGLDHGKIKYTIINSSKLKNNLFPGQLHIENLGQLHIGKISVRKNKNRIRNRTYHNLLISFDQPFPS